VDLADRLNAAQAEVDAAYRQWAEVVVAELQASHLALERALLEGQSVAAAGKWAELNARDLTYDKIRKRALLDVALREHDAVRALLGARVD